MGIFHSSEDFMDAVIRKLVWEEESTEYAVVELLRERWDEMDAWRQKERVKFVQFLLVQSAFLGKQSIVEFVLEHGPPQMSVSRRGRLILPSEQTLDDLHLFRFYTFDQYGTRRSRELSVTPVMAACLSCENALVIHQLMSHTTFDPAGALCEKLFIHPVDSEEYVTRHASIVQAMVCARGTHTGISSLMLLPHHHVSLEQECEPSGKSTMYIAARNASLNVVQSLRNLGLDVSQIQIIFQRMAEKEDDPNQCARGRLGLIWLATLQQ